MDVVVVPEAGSADAAPVAGMADPAGRRRIQRRFAIAAQKRNGVALDRSAFASRAGFVCDVQPQKRHGTDMVAHSRFEFRLRQLDTGPVETEPPRRLRPRMAADRCDAAAPAECRRAGGISTPDGSRRWSVPCRDAAPAVSAACSGSGPSAHGFRPARRAILHPIRSALPQLRRRSRPRGLASSCRRCNRQARVSRRCGLRAGRADRRSVGCRRCCQP